MTKTCTADRRIKTATKFMEEHDPDSEHAHQVCRNSLALFDATQHLHHLGKKAKFLLHAAALMHDMGYKNRPMQHHKGSRDIILKSDLEGFSRRELMIVACLARYHRKAEPNESHGVYKDLNEKARAIVDQMAAILRVADGLDRSHVSSVESLRAEQKGKTLRLFVKQKVGIGIDIEGGARKRGLFERVFGVRLEIVPE